MLVLIAQQNDATNTPCTRLKNSREAIAMIHGFVASAAHGRACHGHPDE
jgi:hypothetical protein